MIKRVVANVMDYDMHNLFYPRPLLDEMADAAEGGYEAQPQVTLRERQYGNQPLLIKPDYKGDFPKKLQEPLEGNLVDVEAADSEYLLDFSMPSEMPKHQEKPHPRVIIDEFYECARPGEDAGKDDLDGYWDRSWDNTDAPEMSEDKPLRLWSKPGENNFHQARNIVASYISPDNQRVGRVIVGFMAGQVPERAVKVAMLMRELQETKIHSTENLKHENVNTRIKRSQEYLGRWVFQTDSGGNVYTTTFQFIPDAKVTDPNELHVRVSCTCPSWLFWGAQYNARMRGYLEGPIRPVFAPPRKRDPDKKFLVCKHVLKCIDLIEPNYKAFGVPKDLSKKMKLTPEQLQKRKEELKRTPKLKFDVKAPDEVIKIPTDLMDIFRRPKIKEIMKMWDKEPKKRKSLIQGLSDEDELTFLAFKYPSTAAVPVADRLEELKRIPEKRQEAGEALVEVKRLIQKVEEGVEPEKEIAIPQELKHLEDDAVFQDTVKNLASATDIEKSRVSRITDPDKLAYVAIKHHSDNVVVSEAYKQLESLAKKPMNPEQKNKAEYWLQYIAG